MTKRLACLLAAIALLFSYCKKDADPETPASLKVDSTSLHLSGAANSTLASFNIKTKSAWQITISEGWLTTNVSTGTGDAQITVQAFKTNATTVVRTATLTIKLTGDTSIPPIIITVSQQPVNIFLSAAKFFGGDRTDYLYSAVKTKDGGFIMTGLVFSDGPGLSLKGIDDIWVIKTDANGNLLWQKAIGGTGSDGASKIIEMEDGGYAVAGLTNSYDGDIPVTHGLARDAAIIRLDADGNIKWKKVWGGSNVDEAIALVQTPDGGLIVAGSTSSNDGDAEGQNKGKSDTWILSLDKDGNARWQQVIGDTEEEIPVSIIKTANDTYLLAGNSTSNTGEFAGNVSSTSHAFIREFDLNGNKLKQLNYGGVKYSRLASAVQTADGGFILTGTTSSNDGDFSSNHGGQDAWLLKIDRAGNKVWQTLLGGTSGELALSTIGAENGYLVAATASSKDGDLDANVGLNDIWIFNVDDKGTIQWQKSFGGTKSEYGFDIFYNTDKTITVFATTDSNDGDCTGNPGWVSPAMFKLTVQ